VGSLNLEPFVKAPSVARNQTIEQNSDDRRVIPKAVSIVKKADDE
jgi:hypothetical protein